LMLEKRINSGKSVAYDQTVHISNISLELFFTKACFREPTPAGIVCSACNENNATRFK
jgi:hypothetical protein